MWPAVRTSAAYSSLDLYLMGLVPPLRVFWYGSAGIAVLLLAYVWLLLSLKQRGLVTDEGSAMSPRDRAAAFAARHVLETRNGRVRTAPVVPPAPDRDPVHVVVRSASELAG